MSAIECPSTGAPRVSVVVLAHRARDELRDCLAALAGQRTSHAFEVVVVLNGASPDVAAFVDGEVTGARIVRSSANRGFAGGCNLGVAAAGGEYLLFLNDDAVAAPTWIDELVTFADDHPGAGAVGGLVLFPDGTVQEAGGVVWREGNTAVVGRGGQPDHPDVAYARRVDYASACALLVRRRAWDDVGGFDEDFFPAYYEDADLCLRLRDRGWEVWYTPAARVVHAESVTAGSAKAAMFRASEATFLRKWSARLGDQVAHGGDPARRLSAAAARARGGGRRVLVIDELAPRPGMGAGYGRMLTVLEALLRRNMRVAFHPSMDRGAAGLGRLGIEVVDDLDGFLAAPHNVLDAVIVSRPDNMALAERVREHQPWAALVYDAEALFSRRFEQWAAMADEEVEREAAARRGRRYRAVEQSIAEHADAIVAISPEERDWFVATGARCPVVLVPPVPDRATFTGAPFSERRGALFVASWLAGPQSPNAHGLRWFARNVLPRLRARIPWVSVHVTGGDPPEQLSGLASAALTFVGHVDDLADEYARARVAISPILWGAGVKLKTVEALAHGVPVVATTVGAEGIPDDWRRHVDVADDPAEFAALLAVLLTDRAAWERRRAGIAELLQHHRFDLGATWANIIDLAVANRLLCRPPSPTR